MTGQLGRRAGAVFTSAMRGTVLVLPAFALVGVGGCDVPVLDPEDNGIVDVAVVAPDLIGFERVADPGKPLPDGSLLGDGSGAPSAAADPPDRDSPVDLTGGDAMNQGIPVWFDPGRSGLTFEQQPPGERDPIPGSGDPADPTIPGLDAARDDDPTVDVGSPLIETFAPDLGDVRSAIPDPSERLDDGLGLEIPLGSFGGVTSYEVEDEDELLRISFAGILDVDRFAEAYLLAAQGTQITLDCFPDPEFGESWLCLPDAPLVPGDQEVVIEVDDVVLNIEFVI